MSTDQELINYALSHSNCCDAVLDGDVCMKCKEHADSQVAELVATHDCHLSPNDSCKVCELNKI